MKHVKISAFDCPDAWFKTLSTIWKEGDVFRVGFGSEETETKKLNLQSKYQTQRIDRLSATKLPAISSMFKVTRWSICGVERNKKMKPTLMAAG